jgi:protocatechuate 3,4-dioxygenase beta subunit
MNAPQGSVSGRVVDAAGNPVSGATVAVTGATQRHRDIAALTSADGRFNFGNMLPGTYQIAARARNTSRAVDVEVRAGERSTTEIKLDV